MLEPEEGSTVANDLFVISKRLNATIAPITANFSVFIIVKFSF